MDFGGEKKRARIDVGHVNGGLKRSKQEMEPFTTGIGSKSKPCTKFFSTSGCPFGEGCHFLHYVPGGINAVTQILGNNPALPVPGRNPVGPSSFPDISSPAIVKTRICNKFGTPEGCKFGDKCRFAHGEQELGKSTLPFHDNLRSFGQIPGRYTSAHIDPSLQNFGAAASFGASATAKISIDASMAGAVIGKEGVNSKNICRLTGARLSVRDHELDPNLRNIELEGSFDQIKQASQMVRELISSLGTFSSAGMKNPMMGSHSVSSNFKTKLCENFVKGCCTFGERCHFAHGAEELRRSGI